MNVSRAFGHRPLPGATHYAASKAALEQRPGEVATWVDDGPELT